MLLDVMPPTGQTSPTFKPRPARPMPAVRCSRVKKDGEQCKAYALRGTTVCRAHGANLPVVASSARERVEEARLKLLGLVPKAVTKVEELLEAESEQVQLRAAESIMNRGGLVETRRTEQDVTHKVEVADLDEAIERLITKRQAPPIDVVSREVGPAE